LLHGFQAGWVEKLGTEMQVDRLRAEKRDVCSDCFWCWFCPEAGAVADVAVGVGVDMWDFVPGCVMGVVGVPFRRICGSGWFLSGSRYRRDPAVGAGEWKMQ
jgi:Pyruvate/2-oxoacid:ferredoxin oxidoreductase delta subunit